jgi:hypothetical protein
LLFPGFQKSRGKKIVGRCDGIDSQSCLNWNLLFTCCPYVGELKVILSQYLTGIKASRFEIQHGQTSVSRTDLS